NATSRPKWTCVARYTTPIPPRPSTWPSTYGPMLASLCSSILTPPPYFHGRPAAGRWTSARPSAKLPCQGNEVSSGKTGPKGRSTGEVYTETRRAHGTAGRWRWIAALSAVAALLVVLAGPARSAASTSVSAVAVNNLSPSSAAGAQTVYVVTCTTSRNGALPGAAGSGITLVFPSGTGLGSVFTSSV